MIYRKLTELKKLPGNPRIINQEDMQVLITSMKNNTKFFEGRPLLLSNRTGELVILGGNQRYDAAKVIGLEEVPTHLYEKLTKDEEDEIIILDNTHNGDWDYGIIQTKWGAEKVRPWGLRVDDWKPMTEPSFSDRQIGSEDIDKAQGRLDNKFNDTKQQIGVICPNCSEEFYV